jgi:hypothetical protein
MLPFWPRDCRGSCCDEDGDLQLHELRSNVRQGFASNICPAVFDRDVAALRVSDLSPANAERILRGHSGAFVSAGKNPFPGNRDR